ncbi:MAG: hypothetical protein AAF974_12685, partial [Cyanobacteria bacterium P01_E01_bin.34]
FDFSALPRRMPRPRWAEEHAAEVAQLRGNGMGTADLAKHFGKSDTSIRQALAYFRQLDSDGQT